MAMKKYRVELEITINDDETSNVDEWEWQSQLNLYGEYGESVEVQDVELVSEWEPPSYDTGSVEGFERGDKVVLTGAWDNSDEDGNEPPIEYCEDDLDKHIGRTGTVIRVDGDDNTIQVEFKWTDDGEELSDTFWIIPRCLSNITPKAELPFKEGDKVRITAKMQELEGIGICRPNSLKLHNKIGVVTGASPEWVDVEVDGFDKYCYRHDHVEKVGG